MSRIEDQMWCPSCSKPHYPPTHTDDPTACNDCGTRLQDDWPIWPRVRTRISQIVAGVILVALYFVPPGFILYRVITGGPLYATRTVVKTTTEYYGVLPDLIPVIGIWVLLLFFAAMELSGAMPRFQ